MKKCWLIFIFLLVFSGVKSQVALNLTQRAWLEQNILSENKILLPVKFNSSQLLDFLKEKKIQYRLTNKNTALIWANPKEILLLAGNENISQLYLELGKPKPLNDTAIIHNNVLPIHSGDSLISPFKGKNVLLGFIDTGIDIDHPDFKDSLGNTRIYRIWDQNAAYDGNNFGYGKIWTNQDIDNGLCNHKDPFNNYGHGTQVSGTATGNGRAVNNYTGMAPEAKIVMVASKFDTVNWLATVAQSVEYIFSLADSLQLPCVINISAGDYYGSHDGLDLPAQLIDSMLKAKTGRAIVCAVGNAGFYPFHIQHQPNNDTAFTWFSYNGSSQLGYGAFFTEAWADSNDVQNLSFRVAIHRPSNFTIAGSTNTYQINDFLNTTVSDTVLNSANDTLAIVDFFASYENGRFRIQFHSKQPDSSSYYFSVKTMGTGKLDFWSASWLGTSEPVSNIPSPSVYPEINHYVLPDTFQTMVSSFTCLPSVITVGNFVNRKKYLDVDSVWQTMPTTVGEIGYTSSLGPTRTGVIKPDLTATGDVTLSACPDTVIQVSILNGQSDRIALGGKHKRNGGSSLASPVVAGITALLLEKCPNMSNEEIKNSLLSTTKTDNFTGNTPNFRWGYGKVNGHKALKSTNFNVPIFGQSSVCSGDSIVLSTTTNYFDYQWNTGENGFSVWVNDSGSYYVMVSDENGCESISDTIQTTLYPIPPKPAMQLQNDTLFTSPNYTQYIWHHISSGNDFLTSENKFAVADIGYYSVTIIDTNGCSNTSDTIFFAPLGIFTLNNPGIKIRPNPANDILTLHTALPLQGLQIINSIGQTVYDKTISGRKITLDVTNLPSGIYHIHCYFKTSGTQQLTNYLFIKL